MESLGGVRKIFLRFWEHYEYLSPLTLLEQVGEACIRGAVGRKESWRVRGGEAQVLSRDRWMSRQDEREGEPNGIECPIPGWAGCQPSALKVH